MAKRMTVLGTVAAAALLAAPVASAMDISVLKVDVPFNFVVGNEQLPSGKYRIVSWPNSHFVRIYSRTQDRRVTASCLPERSALTKGWELVFHNHGGQYFLKTIGTAEGLGLAVPESLSERRAEAAMNGPAVAAK